jgi:antitoxin (DNA-binding transcriptional repressor) of toxin-antitoxin stability system
MPHPTLGLPPRDVTAGLPEAAARLRTNRNRIARLSLQTTVRDADGFAARYDEDMLRLFLRDLEQHVDQLARALETGEDYYVTSYGEWLVPIYRRRKVPMADFLALLAGLQAAAATVMTPDEKLASDALFRRWVTVLRGHQRLAGDHKGNSVLRFFWKGAGIGDDKWV